MRNEEPHWEPVSSSLSRNGSFIEPRVDYYVRLFCFVLFCFVFVGGFSFGFSRFFLGDTSFLQHNRLEQATTCGTFSCWWTACVARLWLFDRPRTVRGFAWLSLSLSFSLSIFLSFFLSLSSSRLPLSIFCCMFPLVGASRSWPTGWPVGFHPSCSDLYRVSRELIGSLPSWDCAPSSNGIDASFATFIRAPSPIDDFTGRFSHWTKLYCFFCRVLSDSSFNSSVFFSDGRCVTCGRWGRSHWLCDRWWQDSSVWAFLLLGCCASFVLPSFFFLGSAFPLDDADAHLVRRRRVRRSGQAVPVEIPLSLPSYRVFNDRSTPFFSVDECSFRLVKHGFGLRCVWQKERFYHVCFLPDFRCRRALARLVRSWNRETARGHQVVAEYWSARVSYQYRGVFFYVCHRVSSCSYLKNVNRFVISIFSPSKQRWAIIDDFLVACVRMIVR